MPNPMRQHAVEGLKENDSFVFTRRFTQEETVLFGDLTRDYNPVHYDKRWTDAKGFRGRICHGLLIGSMICEFGGQVGWLATGMDFKFIRPVYFGDAITCAVRILKADNSGRAEAAFHNQNSEQVAYARLTGRIPVEKERNLLGQMIEEGDVYNKLA